MHPIDPKSPWGYYIYREITEEEDNKIKRTRTRLVADLLEVGKDKVVIRLKNVSNEAIGWGLKSSLKVYVYEIFKEPKRKRLLILEVIQKQDLIGKIEIEGGLAPNEEKIVDIKLKREIKEDNTYTIEIVEWKDVNENLLARLTFNPKDVNEVIIKIPKEIYQKLKEICDKENLDLPTLLNKLIDSYSKL